MKSTLDQTQTLGANNMAKKVYESNNDKIIKSVNDEQQKEIETLKVSVDENHNGIISLSNEFLAEIDGMKKVIHAQQDLIISLANVIKGISNDLDYAQFGYHTMEHKDLFEGVNKALKKLKKKI